MCLQWSVPIAFSKSGYYSINRASFVDKMAENKHFPERTCVGCFKKFPQTGLIAITRLLSGEILVAGASRKAGRSTYLCRNITCFTRAKSRKGKNGLEFSLKVKIPDVIWQQLEQEVKNLARI